MNFSAWWSLVFVARVRTIAMSYRVSIENGLKSFLLQTDCDRITDPKEHDLSWANAKQLLFRKIGEKTKRRYNRIIGQSKIQPNTIDLTTRLWWINPTNSAVIPWSLVLRSIVLAEFYYNIWSIAHENTPEKWNSVLFATLHGKGVAAYNREPSWLEEVLLQPRTHYLKRLSSSIVVRKTDT